jgi:hypothetical protein
MNTDKENTLDTVNLLDTNIHDDDPVNVTDKEYTLKSLPLSPSPKRHVSKRDDATNDLSMLELEMLANKDKIKQVNIYNDNHSDKSRSRSRSRSKSDDSKSRSRSKSRSKSRRSHKRSKRIRKENKDPEMRSRKNDIIYKLSQVAKLHNLHHLPRYDIRDYSFEDLETEYAKITHQLQSQRGVKFAKKSILWSIQGIEFLNNKFDPLGVDLDGWSDAMAYSITEPEYDEVLAELYEKYKDSMSMSPEMRLALLLVQSATLFAGSKHLQKMNIDLSKMFSKGNGNSNGNDSDDDESSYGDTNAKMSVPSEKLELENILKKMEEQKTKKVAKKPGRPKGSKNKPNL